VTVTLAILLLFLALICFVLAAFRIGGRIDLVATGLAPVTASMLVGQVRVG